MSSVIIGTGSYLPERVVTNPEIQAMKTDYDAVKAKGTIDEWARRQHGGISRHWVAPGEATSDMATHAARRAIENSGLDVKDISLIVMATMTNDYRVPQAAAIVQANLGSRAKYFQVDAACSGFIDAMMVAHGLMETQGYENALVIGADTLTYFNDPTKFKPLTVFGDGAGAAVLCRRKELKDYGIRSFAAGSDGQYGDYVWVPGGASKRPFSQEVLDEGLHYWRFKFGLINSWAVERMTHCTLEAIARAGLTLKDINWVVPHQASVNIIKDVGKRLEMPEEKVIITYPHTGNTSAASVAIALHEAATEKRLFADGDWVVMPAVGAGMAWAAMTYRWYDYNPTRGKKVGA